MLDNDAAFRRRRSVATALLFVCIGILIKASTNVLSVLSAPIVNDPVDLPLVSKQRSPNGELTAYLFDTRSSFVTSWPHSHVYISKSNERPRGFDLVFDSLPASSEPMLRWKRDEYLVIDCRTNTRIDKYVNWWWLSRGDDDLRAHEVRVGITCGRDGHRESYDPYPSPLPTGK